MKCWRKILDVWQADLKTFLLHKNSRNQEIHNYYIGFQVLRELCHMPGASIHFSNLVQGLRGFIWAHPNKCVQKSKSNVSPLQYRNNEKSYHKTGKTAEMKWTFPGVQNFTKCDQSHRLQTYIIKKAHLMDENVYIDHRQNHFLDIHVVANTELIITNNTAVLEIFITRHNFL